MEAKVLEITELQHSSIKDNNCLFIAKGRKSITPSACYYLSHKKDQDPEKEMNFTALNASNYHRYSSGNKAYDPNQFLASSLSSKHQPWQEAIPFPSVMNQKEAVSAFCESVSWLMRVQLYMGLKWMFWSIKAFYDTIIEAHSVSNTARLFASSCSCYQTAKARLLASFVYTCIISGA